MKLSTKLLLALLLLISAGMLASNFVLKTEYDKMDKNDPFREYQKILEQSFRHLNISGGNEALIVFEPAPVPSVRVSENWIGLEQKRVGAEVRNDTLFIRFNSGNDDINVRNWMEKRVLVRIFAPELRSVEGNNTSLQLRKFNQTSLDVTLSGLSICEVQSMLPDLDSVRIFESDSSQVRLGMSPEYKGSRGMQVHSLEADVRGDSRLKMDRVDVGYLRIQASATAVLELSGAALQKYRKQMTE